MNTRTKTQEAAAERAIITKRLIHAPRELVFKMFTEPKHISQWWGPRGFTTTVHEMDVKPGGKFWHTMHGPDGTDYPHKMTYKEVVKPERLSYSHGGGREGDDTEFEGLITFEAQGDKTLVTMQAIFPTAAERNRVAREHGAVEGGAQTLDRLEEQLAMLSIEKEFVIARVLDAPRELVWKVCTDPEHLRHWFGPKGYTGRVAKLDFRIGGIYLYSLQTPDGGEIWGKWVFRHIKAPEQIIILNSFSDENAGVTRHPMAANWPLEMQSTFIFEEKNGKTTFTVRWAPWKASETEKKAFSEAFGSMQQGWTGTLDQLTEYLTEIIRK